jgi:hypothetical protein
LVRAGPWFAARPTATPAADGAERRAKSWRNGFGFAWWRKLTVGWNVRRGRPWFAARATATPAFCRTELKSKARPKVIRFVRHWRHASATPPLATLLRKRMRSRPVLAENLISIVEYWRSAFSISGTEMCKRRDRFPVGPKPGNKTLRVTIAKPAQHR